MEQSKTIDLSIVIVSYNVEHFLALCLESVYNACKNINAEIIVIDNASVDNSVEMMQIKFPSIHLISSQDNLGFGKANNRAAKLAKGRYICLLNPDTIVSQKAFEECIQLHDSNASIGISGPQMIDGAGQFLLESKRGLPTLWAAVFKSLGLFRISPRLFGQYYNLSLPQNQNGKTNVLAGAFMFMRKRLYDQLGGFDENFFMYGEDIDISYRSLKLGYSNYYLSQAKVIHFKGESTPKNKTYEKRFFNAMFYYYDKNTSYKWLWYPIFIAGSYFLSKYKRVVSARRDRTLPSKVHQWVLVSKHPMLFNNLQMNMFPGIVQCQNLLDVIQIVPQKLMGIVFDMRTAHWDDVINFMQVHQSRYVYKFISEDHKRIIGSRDVLSRGTGAMISTLKKKSKTSIV